MKPELRRVPMGKDEKIPELRQLIDIQRAHDILTSILMGQPDLQLDTDIMADMMACADVLCWALNHEHSQVFAKKLAFLEMAAAKAGFVFEENPDGYFRHEEPK